MRSATRVLAFLVLLAPFARPAVADEDPLDVVTLYNGRTVEGRVEQREDGCIVLVRRSDSGGVSRFVLKPEDVKHVRYGKGGADDAPRVSSDKLRDAWFLLRADDGRIVGTRRLEMWTLTGADAGFRIEENRYFFAQGRHVPPVHIRLREETDLRFVLVRGLYREEGEASAVPGGPPKYVRSVSGRVEGGVFKGAHSGGDDSDPREVAMAVGTRGRLGLREHLLRRDREVGIEESTLFDLETASQVDVRAGFVGLNGKRDEFHWDEGGTRLISWFAEGPAAVEERLSEGVVAIPATKESIDAAEENALSRARDPGKGEVKLPEGGIRFELPDASWTWRGRTASPTHTGWRVLGRAEAPIYTADVRIELHPEGAEVSPGVTSARAWLFERLKGVARDLQVVEEVEPLDNVADAWRMDLRGTLKGDTKVRTVVVVIDRDAARLVILIACPAASWEAGRPAIERFVASIRTL